MATVNRGFNPSDYITIVPLTTIEPANEQCKCGRWHFYSALCNGLYQIYTYRCGATRTKKGVDTAYCRGKSTRVLIANVKVNDWCPAEHPPWVH